MMRSEQHGILLLLWKKSTKSSQPDAKSAHPIMCETKQNVSTSGMKKYRAFVLHPVSKSNSNIATGTRLGFPSHLAELFAHCLLVWLRASQFWASFSLSLGFVFSIGRTDGYLSSSGRFASLDCPSDSNASMVQQLAPRKSSWTSLLLPWLLLKRIQNTTQLCSRSRVECGDPPLHAQ